MNTKQHNLCSNIEYLFHSYIKIINVIFWQGTVAFNAKEAYVIARKFGPDYKRKFVVKA